MRDSFYQLRPEISGLILYLAPGENDSHYRLSQFLTILNMRMILIISSTFVLPGAIENHLQQGI